MQINEIIEVQESDAFNLATGSAVAYPEPVLLQETKDYIRVSSTSEDTLITNLIKTARIQLEKFTGLSLRPKNLNVILRNQLGNISLPYGPIGSSVTWNNPVAPAVSTDLNISGNQFQKLTDIASPIFNVNFYNNNTGQVSGILSDILNVSYVGGYGLQKQVAVIQVINGGSGYSVAPTVVFTGGTPTTPATATAIIKSGVVTGIVITNPGDGYNSTPSISFTGSNTTPALAIASLGSLIPEPLREAILAQVNNLYMHRGDEIGFTLSPLAKSLASPFKRYSSW